MARIASILLAILSVGCISPHQAYVADVDSRAWDTPVRITVPNTDTLNSRRIELFVRYTDAFVGDSLTLTLSTATPDTLLFGEKVTFRLKRDHKAAATIQTQSLPYRNNVVLRCTGNYNFYIRPSHTYKGVEAVGINIKQ